MPFFLLMTVVLSLIVPGADPWRDLTTQLLAFGGALPLAALVVLVPQARPVSVGSVRSLCGVPEELLADGPADSWAARRRAALWFVMHVGIGGTVSGMTLAVPPAAIVLLALPYSGPDRYASLWWWQPVPRALGPLAGLMLLALLVGTAWAAGALLARCAPLLLGPTPADQLAAAERRAADLASRNRLARELHDSVGHALSAVTLQASAARRVLDADPEFARQALTAIEETTREAVAELDTVLGLLREEDGARPTAPAPTLDGLDTLLDRTRAVGLHIRTTIEGSRAGLPPMVSREAYRIVQEGLSNALRHAGPVDVELQLHIYEGELTLTMENPLTAERTVDDTADAAAPAARTGGGRGLRGIGERARLLGGNATAAARGGVWRLTARLPLGAAR
ncbi:sensor histidine kinase [Streptomyces halobius]|uniref:histidine kinase n=1 Tax=Streptomyces halobius TaxID=2879846 RepID=A0ABY4MJN3_9ACTN|nr:histidine kinase [Streptomyces halobius]UQA98046.1 histidine kinase [Streptomyces halobius]